MRSRAVLAATLLVAVVAGCGGEETLTRADYITQADAICDDYNQRQAKLGDPESVEDIERLGDETKPLVEKQLAELRDLKAPEEIADDAAAAYDLLERQLPKLDALVRAAEANDVAKVQSVAAEAGVLDEQADAKAEKIGLKVCGSS